MKNIHVKDDLYDEVERQAVRHHLTVDAFVERLIAQDLDLQKRRMMSPGRALVGLFSDAAEELGEIVDHAMKARSEQWRLPND